MVQFCNFAISALFYRQMALLKVVEDTIWYRKRVKNWILDYNLECNNVRPLSIYSKQCGAHVCPTLAQHRPNAGPTPA
jgi:hypothetical protein